MGRHTLLETTEKFIHHGGTETQRREKENTEIWRIRLAGVDASLLIQWVSLYSFGMVRQNKFARCSNWSKTDHARQSAIVMKVPI